MKLKNQVLAETILKAVKTFPAVVLTGPRQSGKTTLFQMLFSKEHNFVSLEDPKGFLKQYKPPVIIDEIQYLPELLSYIKTEIDCDRKPDNWLLIGSQNFVLMQNVSQSLAGRVVTLSLLPFSISEMVDNAVNTRDISTWIKQLNAGSEYGVKSPLSKALLRGFYPEISTNTAVDRQLWCGSYITTYLERDVRNIANIGDLSQFERFLLVCATRTGQILNISEMARDIGISVTTAKRWLSLLEASYQIYLFYPYYRNIGKRVVKSPKIYFNDPGLCTYLLGLNEEKTLINSLSYGSLFETMIVGDFLKRFLNFGQRFSMYYLRSRDGLEVDLVIELAGKLHLFEIKSSMTITPKHASSLLKMIKESGQMI